MVWKVRADCTYTTVNNKNSRQSAVESLIASYPEAALPGITGRFPGGVTSQSNTRFTLAYDFGDEDASTAVAFYDALMSTLTTVARGASLVSIHKA